MKLLAGRGGKCQRHAARKGKGCAYLRIAVMLLHSFRPVMLVDFKVLADLHIVPSGNTNTMYLLKILTMKKLFVCGTF